MFKMKRVAGSDSLLSYLHITRAKSDGSDYIVLLRNGRMKTNGFFKIRN